jgi:PTS system glucitol/sorbitol-specific IIA component
MNNKKIASIITGIGGMARELIENGIMVVYNDNAPLELRDIAVLHTKGKIEKDVKTRDTVIFGKNKYTVTAVGNAANRTLKTLGHCTFCFSGADKTELPGQIELSGGGVPKIAVKDIFEIY